MSRLEPQLSNPRSHGGPGHDSDVLAAPESTPFDLFLRILRRHALLLLAGVVLVGGIAYLYAASKPNQYTTSASLYFHDPSIDVTGTASSSVVDPSRIAANNQQLLSLGIISRKAAARLKGYSAAEIASAISIHAAEGSDIVAVEATSEVPGRAAQIANAYASSFVTFRKDSAQKQVQEAADQAKQAYALLTPEEKAGTRGRELSDRIDSLETNSSLQTGGVELVQNATTPTEPSAPRPLRTGLLGAAVGLLGAFALAIFRERRDRAVRVPGDLEVAFGLPLLAEIPRTRRLALQAGQPLAGEEAEAFRLLRASLRRLGAGDRLPRSILIASALPSEGKSTVAARLAETMATMGDDAILVQADLRRPTGDVSRHGLSMVLMGAELDDHLHTVEFGSASGEPRTLTVLSTGRCPPARRCCWRASGCGS
jgi:capsular polysaccharide biosynthesis protein